MNQSSTTSLDPTPSGLQILVLEPDEKLAVEILSALEEAMPGMQTRVARTLVEAQHFVVDQKPALFVLDVDTTYDRGQEFIYDLRTSHSDARAIILTATHISAEREQVTDLGAIHFLEKPFPRADFIALVEALLLSAGESEGGRFQGKLSDLHIADIIQLKCISKATSMLEFTGPRGEKARVYFENGQVRHASTPGQQGLAAFNAIVNWKGGMISEVTVVPGTPHTIDLDWQVLLMEAVRNMDESREAVAEEPAMLEPGMPGHKILVIDDSVMLLSFVKEILEEQAYTVITATTGEEGLEVCRTQSPDMILLDFVLPDMKGDEVCRQLMADPVTSKIPVVYVSGFGSDLQPDPAETPNLIGTLSKPFTSESLIEAVQSHFPGKPAARKAKGAPVRPPAIPARKKVEPAANVAATNFAPVAPVAPPAVATIGELLDPKAYFCGDSSFFSLHWALQTIAREKLTGILRAFWSRDSVDLLAREGQVVTVTSRNPSLYCEESPVTLLNVDPERIEAARARQVSDGCPLFVTLASEDLILREPGLQLVQHYGQKLFSQIWTDRVRFTFEQLALPGWTNDLPATEESIDQWTLSTLRFVQYQELKSAAMPDTSSVPAYTRDGYERVQQLRLTVAEAQFASQFNGSRSIAQISKNLRLDIKFARLTLYRFLALEIVECWPAQLTEKADARGGIRGLFGR